MVVLEVGAIKVGLESGKPLSEFDESGVDTQGVRSEFCTHSDCFVTGMGGIVGVLNVSLCRCLHMLDSFAGFRIHFEGQVYDLLVLPVVSFEGNGVHGDELGISFFEKLALCSEFGQSFLHGLTCSHARCVGV